MHQSGLSQPSHSIPSTKPKVHPAAELSEGVEEPVAAWAGGTGTVGEAGRGLQGPPLSLGRLRGMVVAVDLTPHWYSGVFQQRASRHCWILACTVCCRLGEVH